MGILAAFWAGPWGLMSKILIFAAILGGIWLHGRHNGVESMRPKVEAAESDRDLWKQTADNRLTLMKAQNTAVEALKQSQATRLSVLQNKLAKAEMEASTARQTAERRAEILAGVELSGTECEQLVKLVDMAMLSK